MKKYLNIGLLLIFALFLSCADDFKQGFLIEPDTNEFRRVLSLGDYDYTIDNLDVTEVEKGVRQATLKLTNEQHPLVVHALLVDLETSGLRLEVFPADDHLLKARATPSDIISRYSQSKEIVATINADFFDMNTGEPLGAVMVDGELRRSSNADWKTVFGFTKDNKPFLNTFALDATVIGGNGEVRDLNGYNVARLGNHVTLFDSHYGSSSGTNPWGTDALIDPVEGDWENIANKSSVACKMIRKTPNQGNMAIPKGQVVLSGNGTGSEWVNSGAINPIGSELIVKMGIKFEMNQDVVLLPACFTGAHSILINESAIQSVNEKDEVATARHPRSGIGYSLDGKKMAMIVVDGRIDESIGVTALEFADIFAYFRISNAVNLDGGGSSCLILKDKVLNSLSDGSQRAVTNVFSFVRDK